MGKKARGNIAADLSKLSLGRFLSLVGLLTALQDAWPQHANSVVDCSPPNQARGRLAGPSVALQVWIPNTLKVLESFEIEKSLSEGDRRDSKGLICLDNDNNKTTTVERRLCPGASISGSAEERREVLLLIDLNKERRGMVASPGGYNATTPPNTGRTELGRGKEVNRQWGTSGLDSASGHRWDDA